MKKILYYPVLLVTLILSFATNSAKASHAVGGDLTYTYVAPNQYLLKFRFYRDATGIPAPLTVDICYQSASCGQNGTITLNPIVPTGGLIPPSPCVISSGYLVEEWIYDGTVTLPMACNDWIFSFEQCCRNGAITTLQNGAGVGMYLSTKLDNLNNPVNSSPYFLTIPVTEFCVNNQFYYDQQASDPDGDSLVYSLVAAEDAGFGCPMTPFNLGYNAGWSATSPITSLNGVNLNTQTGLISFIPTAPTLPEVGVICVRVEEWRNGALIGYVKRDIQMNVVANCIISIPSYDSTLFNSSTQMFNITANCGDNSVIIDFQDPIQCGSVVPTDVRALDPNGLPNPVISATPINCVNGYTDSILVTFFYPFTAGTTYVFTKIGNDGNTFLSVCGSQMPEFDSIAVLVVDPGIYNIAVQNVSCFFTQVTITFNSDFTCGTIASNASDFQFVDATGTPTPIVSVTSNCNPTLQYDFTNQLTFTFATGVSGTGPYYLIVDSGIDLNTVANRCGTFFSIGDTLAQLNVTNNIIVNLGNDITVCASDPLPVLDAGNPGVSYTWYFNGTQTTDTTQTILANASGTYVVNCFFSGTCQGWDTINVTIVPAPVVNLGPDINICVGDPIPTLDAGNSGASYQWYLNGSPLPGDTNQTLIPDTSMLVPGTINTYSVTVNTGGSCSGTDDITFTINPGLAVNVGPDLIVCENDPVTLTAGVTANSYQWFDQFGIIPGATGPTYQINTGQAAGPLMYGVIATGPCQGTDTMMLTINAAPSVSITGNTVACITDTLFANQVGTGTLQWFVDGILTTTTSSTFIITLADGNPHTYMVVANNAGCSDSAQVSVTVYPSAPTPTPTSANYCSGTTVPTLDAGVSGSGVTYLWSSGETTQTIVPSGQGAYTVTVSIGGGICTASASATITQVETPQPSLSSATRCSGDATPLILNPGTTNSSFTYQWYDNGGNPIPGATNQTYTVPQPFVSGNYSVTVTNVNGVTCTGSASMTVTVNPSATVDPLSNNTICEGSSATFTATSPNSSPTFVWSGPDSFSSTSSSITINNATTTNGGTYFVTVTDAGGCTGTGSVNLNVNNTPDITVNDSSSNWKISICNEDDFPVLIASSATGVSYTWTTPDASNPVTSSVTVPDQGYGIYEVTVTDAIGCSSKLSVEIDELPCEIIVYNIITPNGDGQNEFFYIKNIEEHQGNNVQIFNRWGNKVFDVTGYVNNSGNAFNGADLPDGTYFYVITAPDITEPVNGTLTKLSDLKK